MKQTLAEKRHEALLMKPLRERQVQRRGLDESLEIYSARLGLSPSEARLQWRAFGLQALGIPSTTTQIMRSIAASIGSPLIAPGIPVPTKNGRGYEERT